MKGGQYVKKNLVDTALALIIPFVDDYVRAGTNSFPNSAGTYRAQVNFNSGQASAKSSVFNSAGLFINPEHQMVLSEVL